MGNNKKAIVALSILGMAISPSIARADIFGGGPPDSYYYADNSLHMYCFDLNYIAAWQNPMIDALTNLQNQTNVTVQESVTCSADTDVAFMVKNGSFWAGIRGQTACRKFAQQAGVCAGSIIVLNSDLLNDYQNRRKTACHELGHSVGLSHAATGDDCMISGSSSLINYNAHHVSHINSYY